MTPSGRRRSPPLWGPTLGSPWLAMVGRTAGPRGRCGVACLARGGTLAGPPSFPPLGLPVSPRYVGARAVRLVTWGSSPSAWG